MIMSRYSLLQIFIGWVIVGGLFFLKTKSVAAGWLMRFRWPLVVKYLLLATPIILVEEYLTCEVAYGQCIRWTLPIFYFWFLLLFVIQQFFKLSWIKAVILFGVLGWFNEFLLVGRIYFYPLNISLIVSPLAFLIYSVMAIWPSYFLAQRLRR